MRCHLFLQQRIYAFQHIPEFNRYSPLQRTVVRVTALPAVAIQQKEMLLIVAFPRNGFPSWKAKNKENSFHSSNDFLFMPFSHDLFHLSAPQRNLESSIRASEKSANFEVFSLKSSVLWFKSVRITGERLESL